MITLPIFKTRKDVNDYCNIHDTDLSELPSGYIKIKHNPTDRFKVGDIFKWCDGNPFYTIAWGLIGQEIGTYILYRLDFKQYIHTLNKG